MHHDKKLKRLYPLLAMTLIYSMCTTGYNTDSSTWYDENPEEDLLGTLFGEEAPANDVQPVGNKWDDWYREGAVESPQKELPQTPGQEDAQSESNNTTANQKSETTAVVLEDHVPEFQSIIINEHKIASENRIELTVAHRVRAKSDGESHWYALSHVDVSIQDNQDFKIVSMETQTDENGELKITLEPNNPFMFFSFVPLEETGFDPYNYAVPVNSLHFKAISFNLHTPLGVYHNYRYCYQMYDVRTVIEAFVNMEIEFKTTVVTFNIYGAESGHPVPGAKITLKDTPPTRLRLLSKYFTNVVLLNYALTVCPYYAVSSDYVYTSLAGAKMRLYCPFDYTFEISHTNFFFKTNPIRVTADTKTIDVSLDRLHHDVKILETTSQQ
ncbi:hypothetical protein JW998_08500 [candidate division KSB1 bacterium]|nr:hypothetical protein [candidate division KSB1 bacterium]